MQSLIKLLFWAYKGINGEGKYFVSKNDVCSGVSYICGGKGFPRGVLFPGGSACNEIFIN